MENNNHIDQIFKRALKNFESQPLNNVWSQIEERLNNEAIIVSRIPYARYAAMFCIFLSLCLISVPLSKKTVTIQERIAAEMPESDNGIGQMISAGNNEAETDLFQASAVEINDHTPATVDFSRSNEILIQPIAAEEFEENSEDFIFVPFEEPAYTDHASESPIDRIFNHEVPMNAFAPSNLEDEDNYEVQGRNIDDSRMRINLKGMYVGVNGSYNQTSIIEYGNIFRGGRPIQPSLKFGTSKGLNVGYNFSNKFGIQADYIYNSIEGQNYVMSEDDEITEKTLALYYDHYQVSAKFIQARFSEITDKPVVINYVAGVQYGKLREYRVPQEKRWETSEELFKDDEWAIVLGLDYDLYLQKNLFVSLGARGSMSNDISTHNLPFDDYAKRNFVFGVRGGLNYVFR